jgi:hypothetical protein
LKKRPTWCHGYGGNIRIKNRKRKKEKGKEEKERKKLKDRERLSPPPPLLSSLISQSCPWLVVVGGQRGQY